MTEQFVEQKHNKDKEHVELLRNPNSVNFLYKQK